MLKPNVDQHCVPRINRRLLGWFRWFVKGYLNKHFHALAVNRQALEHSEITATDALVVYANHASWWDPLIAIHLADRLFPGFAMYAPIDAQALNRYRMFAKMGFFGVEQRSLRGASDFLKISEAILCQPGASLWLTPEGRFADVRDESAELMPGLTHLAWKFSKEKFSEKIKAGKPQARSNAYDPQTVNSRVWFLPVAVEYPFWEERQPEMLVWFGQPIAAANFVGQSKTGIALDLTARLRAAQHQLAQVSIARDSSRFEVMASGRGGTFFIYDWWQSLTGTRGSRQDATNHGQKFNSP